MKCIAHLTAVGLLLTLPAAAHTPQQPPHQLYSEGDLKLESGEAIKDFSISYVTHGTLNAKKSNAILMVTAISGNHHRLDFMIGPGKALDPDKYFIICTDAIANGFSTSPSNSKAQPRMQFPKFTIRDMVQSQYRLMKEKFGIDHVVAVIGPSMGGMQTLQWGVSHPGMMDALVALTPMARTAPWSIAVNHATRRALMLDPAFKDGRYTTQPEAGWRLRADVLQVLATRTPEAMRQQFPDPMAVLPWIEAQENGVVKSGFDANDWIAQTWAYDRHNVGDTSPAFGGDPAQALHTVRSHALLMSGELDLYNPVEDGIAAAAAIPGGQHVTIPSMQGHVAASAGFHAEDLTFINATVRAFLGEN